MSNLQKLNTLKNITNNNIIITKDVNLKIDNRIIPLFSNPVLFKQKTAVINTTYSLKKNNVKNKRNLKNKILSMKEILLLYLKGFKLYNNNLKFFLKNQNIFNFVEYFLIE